MTKTLFKNSYICVVIWIGNSIYSAVASRISHPTKQFNQNLSTNFLSYPVQ